jgi:DNA polymerase I-like protein with 3'-5' exonuclease and polymerase domains
MNLLFLGTQDDKPYLPLLKSCVGSAKVFISTEPIQTLYEVISYCSKREITGVITTSSNLLQKLLYQTSSYTFNKTPSIDNYAGSYFLHDGIEFVILNPLHQLVSVTYGQFIARRFISKITNQSNWIEAPEFNWCIATPSNMEKEYEIIAASSLCAVDIETYKENLAIRCIGFTSLTLCDSGKYISRSFVVPLDSKYNYNWCQKILATSPAKILQNGKYDINYLLRYGLVLNNYAWDTINLMHSWYSELPKDLAFISSFFVRKSMYWKDLAETQDLEQYYLYNAKDTYQTALILLAWIAEAPTFAHTNYKMEFPLVFPCILSELTGIKRDTKRLKESDTLLTSEVEEENELLSQMIGAPNFNTNSPKQKKALLTILGCKDLESTDEKDLNKAKLRHPLNARILGHVSSIQKKRKLLSTYLVEGKELNGRILYSLNPHGTDTGRLASREHHFWCGLQIQNIPRGKTVKSTLVADEGFMFFESDLEQAESRDTAYITGDKNLIAAVSGGKDFHSTNAASFFGMPYESIYNDATKEAINKPIRQLSKNVNHGASYNMGWAVLIDTMGEDKIYEAKRLLKLPAKYTLREVAEHLLGVFTRTYPDVRIRYPSWIKQQVSLHKKLTGATGWTRYCFADPVKSKTALNGYIAHNPQSLNAMTLNKAYMRVFYEVALPNPTTFKLLAQIHDSILGQYKIGHEHLAHKVKELMEIPVQITDIQGIQRAFTVPAALKLNGKYWSEL